MAELVMLAKDKPKRSHKVLPLSEKVRVLYLEKKKIIH
jgi:hypothetical protein